MGFGHDGDAIDILSEGSSESTIKLRIQLMNVSYESPMLLWIRWSLSTPLRRGVVSRG